MSTQQVLENYPNPLDRFNTYSYHFIMTVGNTTEAFRQLTQRSNGQSRVLSAVDGVGLGERLKLPDAEVYLVLDTRRFSQYSIMDVQMEHVYGTGDRINPSVPVATTGIKLIDTTGLTFFNFMMDVLRNKLKSTRMSSFFLLSLVFVGHRDDGETEVISTCNIPLIMLTFAFEFKSTGSEYNMEFMETEGAVQRSASTELVNNLSEVRHITSEGGPPTVGQMFLDLENRLNVQSLRAFQKYQNDALEQLNVASGRQSGVKVGKLVQYMITLPEQWREFSIDTANRSENAEQQHLAAERVATPSGAQQRPPTPPAEPIGRYFQISFSPTSTITDAIKTVLESSLQFLRLGSKKAIAEGEGYAFKTVTNITSNANSYIVHFDVYPNRIPKPQPENSANRTRVSSGTAAEIRNLLTYNYLFTGKNSHIKELKVQYSPESAIAFDTDINIGGKRFDVNASAGQTTQGVDRVSGGTPRTRDFAPLLRPGDPVFPPLRSKEQQQNNTSQRTNELPAEQAQEAFSAKQEHTQTMAFFHFLSSITLDMTIRGNPNLLRKFADRDERGGIAPHGNIIDTAALESYYKQPQDTAKRNYENDIKAGLTSAKDEYYRNYFYPKIKGVLQPPSSSGGDSLLNSVDIATSGLFAKINIQAPNVNFSGNNIEDEPLFTDKFFFQGPYMVLFVKHSLTSGEFTQQLTMIPFDLGGGYSQSSDNNNSPVRN